jgi:hypothetical protein
MAEELRKHFYLDNNDKMKNISAKYGTVISEILSKPSFDNKTYFDPKFLYNVVIYHFSKNLKIFKDYLDYEFDIILNSDFTYFDLLLNIIFLILVIIIIMIMYWDNIYRTATKKSRCSILDTIINENKVLSTPYVYYIYIYDNTKKIDDYDLVLKYDFNRKIVNINYGKDFENNDNLYNKNSELNVDPFKYFDLEKMNTIALYNINSKKITDSNYIYKITDSNNKEIKSEYAIQLKNFIRKYGRDTSTPLHPIYDIIYSIDKETN